MEFRIGSIVEGHGEVEALPILIRRIAEGRNYFHPDMKILPPLRTSADKLRKVDELERAVAFTANKIGGSGGILILLDADWEGACPAKDGPALLARAKAVASHLPVSVVLARMEYEAWFLASAESLRGFRGLPIDLTPPDKPEEIRGAKGWLSRQMQKGRTYSETEDQPAFTSSFDLNLARRARSFDKCYREVDSILSLSALSTSSDVV